MGPETSSGHEGKFDAVAVACLRRPFSESNLTMALTPLTQRRIANFKANRRGYWSLWIFLALFVLSPVCGVHRQR